MSKFYVRGCGNNMKVTDKIMKRLDNGDWARHPKSKLWTHYCRGEWEKLTGIIVDDDKQVCIDISDLKFSIVDESDDRKLNAKDKRRLRLLKTRASKKIKAKKPFYIAADDLDDVVVCAEQMRWKDENDSPDNPEWVWLTDGSCNQEELTIDAMSNIFKFHIPWGVQLCVSPRSMKVERL